MQQPSNFELRGQKKVEKETELNSFFSGVWNRQYAKACCVFAIVHVGYTHFVYLLIWFLALQSLLFCMAFSITSP
jgi:hypothetical protein